MCQPDMGTVLDYRSVVGSNFLGGMVATLTEWPQADTSTLQDKDGMRHSS